MPKRSHGIPEENVAYARALGRAIGQRLHGRRVQLQLSQEQVRAQMGLEHVHVSRSKYSRIETGQRLPDAAELNALVTVLRVPCAWLLSGPEEQVNASGSIGGDRQT